MTVIGRSAGDGPISQMKSASRSMPTPVERRADEHRELEAVEHLVGQRALELGGGRHVAGQVALELLVVAGDDLLDELVVQPVLLLGDVGRERLGVVLPSRLVLEALVATARRRRRGATPPRRAAARAATKPCPELRLQLRRARRGSRRAACPPC